MAHTSPGAAPRKGDKGMTRLATGLHVEKDSPRVLAIGAVDELNSWIGVVLAHGTSPEIRDCLVRMQEGLLQATAQLSSPGQQRITDVHLLEVERAIDLLGSRLPPLTEPIVPGGSLAGAVCHLASTVCRRVETCVVGLSALDPVENDALIPFLNRLSDLLFLIARSINEANGAGDRG